MASSADDDLEIGCLSVRLVAARNIKIGAAGMVDILFGTQLNPYCKISLGVRPKLLIVSPVQWYIRGQGNIIFPVQLTTSRIGNLSR